MRKRHVYCSMCGSFLGSWTLWQRLTRVRHCADHDACFWRWVARTRDASDT